MVGLYCKSPFIKFSQLKSITEPVTVSENWYMSSIILLAVRAERVPSTDWDEFWYRGTDASNNDPIVKRNEDRRYS